MGKYPDQKKLAAARDYCSGQRGLREVAQRHGVNVASLRLWAGSPPRPWCGQAFGRRTVNSTVLSSSWRSCSVYAARSCRYRQAAALFNVRRHDMIGSLATRL